MQLQGRTEEATKALHEYLKNIYKAYKSKHAINLYEVDQRIHEWLPGVKSMMAGDYSMNLYSAKQCLPPLTNGQNIWCVEYHGENGYSASVENRGCKGYGEHFNEALALITASVSCILDYFQKEKEKESIKETN
jgi:hypothetical protein